jgi:hypothetical protein
LIKAALGYREERGIPFAAYALPRIHNAVSRALHTKFRNVYVPPQRNRPGASMKRSQKNNDPYTVPREYSMGDEPMPVRSRNDRHDPDPHPSIETIGDRLRARYEQAVRRARLALSDRASSRGDRDVLLAALERERFMVPQEEERRPLRQIARDTKSSYARVAQCDKRMAELARQFLEEDVEFLALRDHARHSPVGSNEPVDAHLDRCIADAYADRFTTLFQQADPASRGVMLNTITNLDDKAIEKLVRDRFRAAQPAERADLLSQMPP